MRKRITEEQAQELAKILGGFIAIDRNKNVHYFEMEPIYNRAYWFRYDGLGKDILLNIEIETDKQWEDCIWHSLTNDVP